VIGTATSDAGAEKITAYMQEAGIQGQGMMLNVTDPDAITATIKQIADTHGAVTLLINNAGITRDNLLMRMKEEEWGDIMDTNLTSIFRVSKACLRGMMKARSGRIISITSVVGAMGNAGQSNYAAAKAGVMGFSKSLAREVASRGVTVNTVAPGFIDTDMTKSLPEEQKEALKVQIPAGALGQPEDIANAVAFLASDEASYVTGQTLHINGGMYM
jgi:3-oxoacyl-[acyl-carrier protein] reductase